MKPSAVLAMTLLASLSAGTALAQPAPGAVFPGDRGRPGDGLPIVHTEPRPPRVPDVVAPSLPMESALKLAKAAVAACSAFHVGVSIIDASGAPKLYYIPDGTAGVHAYTGFRKAFAALSFSRPTSAVAEMGKTDKEAAARIAADTRMLAWAGGVPIVRMGVLVGAIGVSGAEPSAQDEACAVQALAQIAGDLK